MHSTVPARPSVSIIVPIYNVQDYLPAALDSIIRQAFSHPFEIILVDDCSTDQSKAISEHYARIHPEQIKLFCHSDNSGISVARNTGLKAVTGTYFTFVDPDDLLPPTALQTLYDAAIHHQADIVKGNHQIFDETGYRPASTNIKRTKIYTGDAILSAFFAHKEVRGFTWGKLFLSSAFAQIPNTPGVKMAQDTLYCAELFALASKLVLIEKDVYHYRLRHTGITRQKFITGNYLWWLYSIENAGRFARTPTHRAHHKKLQIDILLQLATEAHQLDPPQQNAVIKAITNCESSWKTNGENSLTKTQLSARAWIKWLRLRRKLYQLQKRITTPPSIKG